MQKSQKWKPLASLGMIAAGLGLFALPKINDKIVEMRNERVVVSVEGAAPKKAEQKPKTPAAVSGTAGAHCIGLSTSADSYVPPPDAPVPAKTVSSARRGQLASAFPAERPVRKPEPQADGYQDDPAQQWVCPKGAVIDSTTLVGTSGYHALLRQGCHRVAPPK